MLTSKQRSKLRAMANTIESTYHIGKDGVTDIIVKELNALLEARELIKITINKNSGLTAEEAINEVCEKTGANPVSAIGGKIIIYKRSTKKPKIELD
ncbi:MAG: YhbY family RNA-binding protein [Christensenellales bacterium]|jgi:RNA-binding protein|nr:YhbY family RNA-binding protein [Clostridiales bacterium]